jgi:hypothetical protein
MWQHCLIITLVLTVVLGILHAVPPQAKQTPFSPAPVSRDIMERNKKAALQFYDLAINKKDYEAASKYLGADYKQHNPLVGDGKEGFKAFLAMLRRLCNHPRSFHPPAEHARPRDF